MAWRERLRRRALEDGPRQETTWEAPVPGSTPDWPFDDPTVSPEFLAGFRTGYDAGPAPAGTSETEPSEPSDREPSDPEPSEPRAQEAADQDAPIEDPDPGDAVRESDRSRRRMLVALLAALALGALALLWPRDALAPTSAPVTDRITAAPVPLGPQESFVRSRVDAEGVTVEQWIAAPGEELTLSLPPTALLPDDVRPTVASIAVVADGGEVEGPGSLSRGAATWSLPPGTDQVQVSYVVNGSIRRSSTKPDRALVWLLALRTDAPPAGTIHRIEGGEVRALACQAPDDDLPRTCGEPDGSGWTMRSTPDERDVLVTAQVDLAGRP